MIRSTRIAHYSVLLMLLGLLFGLVYLTTAQDAGQRTEPEATPEAEMTPEAEVTPDMAPEVTPEPTAAEPRLNNCGQAVPDDWFRYVVQPGDTFGSLAARTEPRLSVRTLQQANCIAGILFAGEVIYSPSEITTIPFVPRASGAVQADVEPAEVVCPPFAPDCSPGDIGD